MRVRFAVDSVVQRSGDFIVELRHTIRVAVAVEQLGVGMRDMELHRGEQVTAGAGDLGSAHAAQRLHATSFGVRQSAVIVELRHPFVPRTIPSVLVGRERELERLAALIRERRPVLVLGEAGVGKTTLVRAAAEANGTRLFEAGALATLSWLPYLPLRRALGREMHDRDSAEAALEVERGVDDGILLLDDLHWADRETRLTLPYLVGRIAVVVTVRRGDPESGTVLAELDELRFSIVNLEPLDETDASTLARRLRPELSPGVVDRIVHRSGGNPLLLEELAATGEPTESLILSVQARLRQLGADARGAMVLLGLAGRPLRVSRVGPGLAELQAAGLVVDAGGDVAIRHALLAEAASDLALADERRDVHARLARLLRDPGESARHHAAAGETAEAYRKAVRAAARAATPGERAAHLALAATCAEGERSDRLRVDAAAALVETGLHDRALELLADVAGIDPVLRAEVCLLEAKIASVVTDYEAARAKLAGGAALVVGTGSEVEVRIAVERVFVEVNASELADVRGDADAAYELAVAHGTHEALALYARAMARRQVSRSGWRRDFEAAMASARQEVNIGLECEIAEEYGSGLGLDDGGRRARLLFREMVERTRELGLTGWERRFRTRSAWVELHAGAYRTTYEAGETLLGEALPPWQRFLAVYVTAQAAIDLGLHDRAHELVAELYLLAVSGPERLRTALLTRADLELWSGRPRQALAVADEAFARFGETTTMFVCLTRGWACADLGLDPGEPIVDVSGPFFAGARPELEALRLLVGGEPANAAERFVEAARLWRRQHARGELRCLWAAGEALRVDGRSAEAVEALLVAERRAAAHEHLPLLRRVHRSLRLAGVRRSAPRGAGREGLTAREQEILGHVAGGLSNPEIARRLGVSRPTVERLVASASRKLGAKTRAQAAALAERGG